MPERSWIGRSRYTWFDPGVRTKDGLNLRRPTNEQAAGWGGLWSLFEKDHANAAAQMVEITFKTHAKILLAAEYAKILGCAKDHNCCSVCKLVSTKLLNWHERAEGYRQQRQEHAPGAEKEDAAKYAELTQQLEEAEKEHKRHKDILARHNARNIILRAFANRLIAVGVALKDAGEPQMMSVHNDDKTAAQVLYST